MKFSEFVNQNIDESIMGFKLDNTKMPKEFVADYDADYPRDLYKEYDKLRRKTEAARKRLLFKKDSDYQDFQKYDLQYLTKEKAEEKLKIAKVQRSKIEALEKEIKGWAKKNPGYYQNSSLWCDVQEALTEINAIIDDMDLDKTLQKSIQHSKESIKSYVRSIFEKCGEFDNILRELDHTSLYTTERIYNFMERNYDKVGGSKRAIGEVYSILRGFIRDDTKN